MSSKHTSKEAAARSLVTPIFQTSVFGFETVDEMIAAFDGTCSDFIYTRISNPGIVAVEQKLAALEKAHAAVVFASGLAASFAVFSTLLKSGDEVVVSRDLYGGTLIQLKEYLEKWNVGVRYVDMTDNVGDRLRSVCNDQTRMIFFESPTNPTLKIIDIEAVTAVARSRNLLTVADNTFATPVNQLPLEMNVDLVVHSATKYLGGHDDLTAGVVAGKDNNLIEKIRRFRTYAGAVLDPHSAFLLDRGLKTLDVRMAKHNANAAALATFLTGQKHVKRVYYPGQSPTPGHQIARKQMSGFGGMVSFEIEADRLRLNKFLAGLNGIPLIPSLGGVETTILIPAYSSHFYMPADEKIKLGISEGLIRVNVGIEPIDVIRERFESALGAMQD